MARDHSDQDGTGSTRGESLRTFRVVRCRPTHPVCVCVYAGFHMESSQSSSCALQGDRVRSPLYSFISSLTTST